MMSTQQRSGDVISARIDGGVSGQVAIGKAISQIQTFGASATEITEAERTDLQQKLTDLRTQVGMAAPPDKQGAALERVDELAEAVTAKTPDLSTMEYVNRWFVKNLPQLTGSVVGVVTHPVVGKLVEVAGDGLAAEFRRRFGGGPGEGTAC
jgi:hypothetical protein